jgi:L,D-transpeptidase ErfK/SrfK
MPVIASGQAVPGRESVMTGGESVYHVVAGDTLTSIGARYGIDASVLARRNGLRAGQRLALGQTLTIDNRHLVPAGTGESLVINIPQRMLFQFRDGALHAAYPVGLGRPTWQTPLGAFTVVAREENPTWRVPPSIQEEMRRAGKPVITIMPPCPANPLGQYRIVLSLPGIGIHGTIAPASIYQFQTHGCIRLHPDDICALFGEVSVGDTGRIIYEPALLAQLVDGRVFVEVHRDIYRRGPDAAKTLRAEAESRHVADAVDWDRVAEVVREHEGLAIDVTLGSPTAGTPLGNGSHPLRDFPEIDGAR